MVKIKHKDFIGAVPIMLCLNSSWIMGLRIYGEGRTQIPLSSPATIGPLQGSRIDRVYTDIKIANNTKINHIMVSFTNHYNAISIDRLPSKTKIGKYSWYFNNSLYVYVRGLLSYKDFSFSINYKKNKNKYSCSGLPAFKSESCRLRFS